MRINGFRPPWSDSLPNQGKSRVLDREKEPNISATWIPAAPILVAYTGSRGTTIPTPVMVAKRVKNRVKKIPLWGMKKSADFLLVDGF